MKKMSIYLVGLLSAVSTSMGVLLGLLNFDQGNKLAVVGVLVVGFLFLPLMFWYDKILRSNTTFRFGMFAGLLLALSVLFKALHLQGGEILLWIFALVFTFVFLPVLFYEKYNEAE